MDEVSVNTVRVVRVENREILLARTEAGIYALENRCAHQPQSLENATIQDGQIRCPFHSVRIDPATGGIAFDNGFIGLESIKSYPCKEKDGFVWIRIE